MSLNLDWLSVTDQDDHAIVRFTSGTLLTESNCEDFARAVESAISGRDAPHVIIDLTGVRLLTSEVLNKLLKLHDAVTRAGGSLRIVNASSDILKVFKVTRLDTILNITTAS